MLTLSTHCSWQLVRRVRVFFDVPAPARAKLKLPEQLSLEADVSNTCAKPPHCTGKGQRPVPDSTVSQLRAARTQTKRGYYPYLHLRGLVVPWWQCTRPTLKARRVNSPTFSFGICVPWTLDTVLDFKCSQVPRKEATEASQISRSTPPALTCGRSYGVALAAVHASIIQTHLLSDPSPAASEVRQGI